MRVESGAILNQPSESGSIAVGGDRARLENAAKQFEALLIGQILKGVRESSSGLSAENDESMTTYSEIAEQQFAQAIAAQGGMGIGKMVTAQFGDHDANQQ